MTTNGEYLSSLNHSKQKIVDSKSKCMFCENRHGSANCRDKNLTVNDKIKLKHVINISQIAIGPV